MEEDEQEQRRRKVEAGRAKLAHFRQRKTKGDCAHSKKKTAKRKGLAVHASVQEESPSPVVTQEGGLLEGGDICRGTACSSSSPDWPGGAFATQEQDQDCEPGNTPEDKAGWQQQPQATHSLELEALRLSLSNMHTVQLELTQANLQKEKETALTELREMLNGRRAQELALLQSRQQCELELVQEQHTREKEAMAHCYGQEIAELKEKLRSEVEKNAQMIETLKQDWESERELCLENLRKELSARHQSEMENLQNQFQKELAEQRAELEKVFQGKTQAEVSLKSLEAEHQAAVRKVREDLQLEHCQYLENLELKFREKEKEKQLELKFSLVEDHQEEVNKAEEKIQLLKQEFKKKEAEWESSHEDLKREDEEKVTSMLLELQEKAELEKQSIISRFELREAEMKNLQDQQAAQILDLEKSLMEQQRCLRQLEQGLSGDDAPLCSRCGQDTSSAQPGEHITCLQKEDCSLQLMLAQNRFLEERKKIVEKFATEQDAFLRDTQEKHTRELQLLQQRHQQRLLSLRTELESKHQTELAELMATLESEWQVLLETRVAELQVKHAAEISALEKRHLSNLDALESCYLSEMQIVRDEHRQALELLQADLEEQLRLRDSSHQVTLTQELEKLKQKHNVELQSTKDSLRTEMSTIHAEQLKVLDRELQGAHQDKFESEQKAVVGGQEVWSLECEPVRQLSQEQDPLQLQAESQTQQLKDQVLSLRQEVEECRAELERLQQRRERENQEGATLISMLRADVDLSQGERRALHDALRRLLGLFGETLKAAIALKSRIGERVGLLLDHADTTAVDQAPSTALEEVWSDDAALLELDRILPEGAEMSSVEDISSHVCESFFMSPESTLECEQPIKRVYQSLSVAVDGLLEMALDSSRQLEEARQLHSRFEKEFSHKNEETAQVVQKHQELLECLRAEGTAKATLALELHTAEGLLEGLKVEKAGLQDALARKEASEQQLVLELESLGRQLQQAAEEQAVLREEHSLLRSQKEAQAVEAEARVAGTCVTAAHRDSALQKEVETLTTEHSESRRQAEKDCAALLSQMRVLESELEEQLLQHQGCAQQIEEATILKQQLAALDKHLRSQRQFMDEQAAEREHEREEFQQEIQKLEGQLRQAAKLRPPSPHDSQQCLQLDEEVELLQEKLREKSDECNELAVKKELADRQVLIQEEEIKHLEAINAHTRGQVALLQEELEKQKNIVKELQVKEALTEPQTSDLLHVPTSHSGPNGSRCPVLLLGSPPEAQPEIIQMARLQDGNEVEYHRSSEVEELKSIIENLQENQERLQKDKAEEIEQLHEIIEKLQGELVLLGPVVHELSDHQADSLHSELLCFQADGPCGQTLQGQALQGELEAALSAKETLVQLLADQSQGHSKALEALQQRLQAAEEAAARQLAELGHSVALREAEVEDMTARIQEFEAILKAKEAIIMQRDLEIDAMNKQKEAHFVELEAILLALARFRHTLEQQPPEPPELQRLRAQCIHLARQLQVLNQWFLRCQVELDKQQARGVLKTHPHPHVDTESGDLLEQGGGSRWLASTPHGWGLQDDLQPAKVLGTLKDADLHKPENVVSVLTFCQRQLEAELLLVKNEIRLSMEDDTRAPRRMKGQGKWIEDCWLRKVDLIAQVQQLQEKLNCLSHSMAFQDADLVGSRFQPSTLTYLSENSSSSSSCGKAAADLLLPVDTLNNDKTTWDLTDVIKNQDSSIIDEMPNSPTQEKIKPKDVSLSLQTSVHSDSLRVEEAKPPKDPETVQDLSSWSSPEVLRKDSSLEPCTRIPLTPCSGAMSLCSAEGSPQHTISWLLQSSLGRSIGEQTPLWTATPSSDHQPVERMAAEKDVEDFTTSFESRDMLRSPPPGLEEKNDESAKSDGPCCGAMLNLRSGQPAAPTAGPVTAAPVSRGFLQPPGQMQEKEVHTKHVKALLQMVCDESHQILALSESRDLPSTLSKGEPYAHLAYFLGKGQGLLEVTPKKGEKKPLDLNLDWKEEFPQATQGIFEREQKMVQAELQPGPCGSDPGDHSSPCKKLEKVVQEQEKTCEHLCLPDRSTLLSEIQALRAQLRMTHLQNQEKLQQLCEALTSTEARSSRREHQLRRQVELLAYKVEQEKCIASDLQKTLSEEQERARGVRQLLAAEQSTVQDLQSELRECQHENTRLLESLGEAQREVLQLRSLLDGKESDLKAALEELEHERGKERILQAQQEEEQLRHLQKEGQSSKALEELKVSLEKQFAQNSQLNVALNHERTVRDNLQQELQIEQSRCEALLAQERGQLAELQRSLEAEKKRALELSEALQHERLVTEQLSRGAQQPQPHHVMLRKLKAEKARVLELQATLQVAQQQALQAQQQLEAQVQERCAALGKEKERELELQRQRDEHKIEQLQQTVQELQSKVEMPGSGPRLDSLELGSVWEQQQGLEKIRQKLLCVAGLLTSLVSHTMDRTLNDGTLSGEKAVSSLVQTLQGLKSELSMSTSHQKKIAAELQVQLVDVLLRDNDSLTEAISTVTKEKAELCRAVSRLEKTLRHHVQKGCILSRSGRSAWRQDGTVSQSLPRNSDSGQSTLTAREKENTYSIKMEKLYLHYLRAESFRKALIYQKKYLLLLIGGFQDSEQETLSMIAHLGVFPSKADKKISTSRPFTRFRTAVRVVIAVLRLRFLVKKWQEVDQRGTPLLQGKAPHPGPRVPWKQPSPLGARESPPTRDGPSHHTRDSTHHLPSERERCTPSSSSRLERSLTASQDPERSLTEYIHHLEMIQQRLGGAPPDSNSKKSCRQKIKQ
ncbi:pericentrin isoform X8 [Cavia porcellus]|uniref:pericentrin isoform X8 n=1 Tax=Cavia porcellus TaxID=10141 RepID=UPI002FE08655